MSELCNVHSARDVGNEEWKEAELEESGMYEFLSMDDINESDK